MAITLTGTLEDITGRPVEEITRVTVKAPVARPGAAITTSQPRTVDLGKDGTITFDAVEGPGWLYIEGPGWSDSIKFVAAAGMTQLWEALVNASGTPGFADYLKMLLDTEKVARELAAAAWAEIGAGQSSKFIGYPNEADRYLRTDANGKLVVSTGTITEPYDVANKAYVDSASFVRGNLTAKTNLDALSGMESAGAWQVNSTPVAEALGLPAPGIGSVVVLWAAGKSDPYFSATQLWLPAEGGMWMRSTSARKPWTKWAEAGGSPQGGGSAATGRADLLRASRGGRIGTGGKAVVSLRFDHNLGGFDEKIKPLLLERGIPATMPCFVDMMNPQPGYSNDDSAAAGKTWTDLAQNFYRGIEVFSHSYSHQDAATTEDLEREIVQSRSQLESNVPDLRVHGWGMPGVGGTQYMGWWKAWVEPETRLSHPAGQLLGSTYGTYNVSGYGYNELGKAQSRYFGIEDHKTASTAKSYIDQAIATTTGVTLMMHPNKAGTDGYIPLSVFEEILDYIVEKRDAGEIIVLTMGGQAVADPSTAWRHNLTPPISKWSKSGNTLSTSVTLSRMEDIGGGMRELVAEVEGTGSVKLAVEAPGAAVTMNIYRTFDVSGGDTVRMPFGVPRRAANMKFTVEATGVTITNAGVYAI